jgi:hypothetical protein
VAKADVLVLRISAEDKASIKAAAEVIGKSLTTFITEAAVKQAAQVKRRPPRKQSAAKGVHGGVPTFFRACCYEAAQGGENGYDSAAWHLANSLGSQQPYDIEADDWAKEMEALQDSIGNDDDQAIWEWFKRHYPKCIALVPVRRRAQFVAGVRRAAEDGRIDF